MTQEQYLLVCLMEECNEVAQECAKALRFGLHGDGTQDTTPQDRLIKEINDFTGTFLLMKNMSMFGSVDDLVVQTELVEKKKLSLLRYLEKNNG